jgi:HAD superfamily hydrolase (TIGR01458 family)
VDDVRAVLLDLAAHLREHHPDARCLLLNSGDVTDDLEGGTLVGPDGEPEVVVLGGAGPEFTYEALNAVFGHLQRGAALVALHRNLYWRTDQGLELDTGALLLGLEKAADVEATIVGKPSSAFFAAALRTANVSAEHAVMVGDDIEADVLGAQAAGIAGVLVRTGKYRGPTRKGHAASDRATWWTPSPTCLA